MLAATVFTVIIATFGPITCAKLSSYRQCQDEEFHGAGYSLGCTYSCLSGNEAHGNTYYGHYTDATVCVDLTDDNPEKFKHIGTLQRTEK
uniref:Putative basic tail protein n=1 Tax=Ixodes ricinus TaxID=34613 RepID=A0A0K8RL83_IXORI